MVRALLFFTLFLIPVVSPAESSIPDPLQWFTNLPDEVLLQTPGLIRNISIDSKNLEKKLAWKKLGAEFSRLGFLQFYDPNSLNFGRALITSQANLPSQSQLLGASPIQLLLNDQDSNLTVMKKGASGLEYVASWTITPNDRRSPASFQAWLSRNLGYDAIVLAQRAQYVLVGLLKKRDKLGQGVLLNDSASSWQVDASKLQSDTLLQMVRMHEDLAVFEILFEGDAVMGQIASGSKIVLGGSENVQKVIPEKKRRAR